MAPAALVAIASLTAFGDARFRVALDVALCVLVAVAIDRILAGRAAGRTDVQVA